MRFRGGKSANGTQSGAKPTPKPTSPPTKASYRTDADAASRSLSHQPTCAYPAVDNTIWPALRRWAMQSNSTSAADASHEMRGRVAGLPVFNTGKLTPPQSPRPPMGWSASPARRSRIHRVGGLRRTSLSPRQQCTVRRKLSSPQSLEAHDAGPVDQDVVRRAVGLEGGPRLTALVLKHRERVSLLAHPSQK